ncbi:hypothetical protein TREMEDRAFT_62705 [Tremella mesenterica DSM 1558]|uniref:uncharacterized protein n=1 Tax=Tremella mesenterica (strain ATCC 24925 / CBS 8224 / DSM 1558 / NBRC 9311 / NRRL Y-6157 / RJB 2259-6 / UBC 559-6) TaxID=578456 RepID=UPI0003F49DF3|nr:uncharacterized protein TREMEDRAFT_62705 [Tremella mesenterica DSM 1558]EIW68989.1 hypothetical protein TREMEDRAFT_62705 [Tremella mesenterica DSM 1558]
MSKSPSPSLTTWQESADGWLKLIPPKEPPSTNYQESDSIPLHTIRPPSLLDEVGPTEVYGQRSDDQMFYRFETRIGAGPNPDQEFNVEEYEDVVTAAEGTLAEQLSRDPDIKETLKATLTSLNFEITTYIVTGFPQDGELLDGIALSMRGDVRSTHLQRILIRALEPRVNTLSETHKSMLVKMGMQVDTMKALTMRSDKGKGRA